MMQILRIVSIGLLVALIGLTSQTMAMARGQAAATGQITLCTGHGAQVITVDAEGNPTRGGQFCPECVLVSWDLANKTDGTVQVTQIGYVLSLAYIAPTPRLADRQALGARGPPSQV